MPPMRAGAAPAGTAAPEDLRPPNQLLLSVVEKLFSIKPIWERASRSARQKIVRRSEEIGLDFEGAVQQLRDVEWAPRLAAATAAGVAMPSYYTRSFHAYPQGNLCWDAAMEFEVASRSVHSPVMSPDGAVDPQGDDIFRATYMNLAKGFIEEGGARPVEDAVDLGCATGLSSEHVRRAFPGCRVTGVDLSPHMIAVGRYLQEQRLSDLAPGQQPLQFVHGNAEATGLPDSSTDLVTLCLVAHELPADVTRAIFREAYRLLRPGGALAVMEMDPRTEAFKRILRNPAAYCAFKATEPWLLEYIGLDMQAAVTAAGFAAPYLGANSPRHKTVVAIKPQ